MPKKENAETAAATFIDRTQENWYMKSGSNRVSFCKSIDDIIDGKAESVEFTIREMSLLKSKNKNDVETERNSYVLFTTTENLKILVRKRDELK